MCECHGVYKIALGKGSARQNCLLNIIDKIEIISKQCDMTNKLVYSCQ